MPAKASTFDKPRHVKYWTRCANLLPQQYTTGDGSRLSLAFFVVAALDLLNVLETTISLAERQQCIEWIYSLQVPSGGFRGFPGTNLGPFRNSENEHWDPANLHNTFLGLVALVILGDDLGRVRRRECLKWVKRLAKENGGFGEMVVEGGTIYGKDDLRSLYCAVGIVYVLADEGKGHEWLSKEKIVRYLSNCQDSEGAFGQACLREAHAGLNFCGMATLACLDRIFGTAGSTQSSFESPLLDLDADVGWMVQRQTTWIDDSESENESENETGYDYGNRFDDNVDSPSPAVGFGGRCNKMADTCYCFWNGAALALLDRQELIEINGMRQYLCGSTQHMIGGFAKVPGAMPDLLHAYLGLAALAIVPDDDLLPLDSALAVSRQTRAKLEKIRQGVTNCTV